MCHVLCSFRGLDHHEPGRVVNPELTLALYPRCDRDYAAFLNCSNRIASRSRIRVILAPPRQLDHLPDDSFQSEFDKRAVMDFEQPIRHMDAEIRVDTDQVSIEGAW